MSALTTAFLDAPQAYTGEQLRSGWIAEQGGITGDGAVAFIGPCDVAPEYMRDLEDLAAGESIASENMLHFIIEHGERDLPKMVWRQWLFTARIAERLNRRLNAPRIVCRGSDLYDDSNKVTVSIATLSPVSGLIHTGINISSRNTPVPTRSLDDFGIDARDFGDEMLAAYAGDCAAVLHAAGKVRPCP